MSVLTEDSRKLGLGQMLGDASMGAKAEAERVLSRPLPVHVEDIGALKDIFIPVGGLVRSDDALIGLDELFTCQHPDYSSRP
jgi:hypothetical protein